MQFTPYERRLIIHYAHANWSRWPWVWYYLVAVGPLMVFAGIGIWNREVSLVAIAFIALLMFNVWRWLSQRETAPAVQSIFKKLAASLEGSESTDTAAGS